MRPLGVIFSYLFLISAFLNAEIFPRIKKSFATCRITFRVADMTLKFESAVAPFEF